MNTGATLTNLAITLTPAGQPAIVVNHTTPQLWTMAAPTAVDELTVSWGRPSSHDHAEPGDITATLISRDLIAAELYEAELSVTGDWTSPGDVAPTLFGRGWVREYLRSAITLPTPTGEQSFWRYDLVAGDIHARAAGSKIAPAEWPSEIANARFGRIDDAVPYQLMTAGAGSGAAATWSLAPVDPNGSDALSLAQRTAMAGAWFINEAADGLILTRALGPSMTWTSPTIDVTDPWSGARVPAGTLSDEPRRLSRLGMITQVKVNAVRFSTAGGAIIGNASHTYTAGPETTSSAVLTLDTDLMWADTQPTPSPALDLLGQSLVDSNRRPIERLSGVQVALDLIPYGAYPCRHLTGIGTYHRASGLLYITDAPTDVTAEQVVIRGELTISAPNHPGDPIQTTLIVDLEPLTLVGLHDLTWDEAPNVATFNKVSDNVTLTTRILPPYLTS